MIVGFPFTNRNPSTIADQLTDASSCVGGDGFIRHTVATTTRNVATSKTNAPAGWINRISTPASAGPAIPASVPKPDSSAFDDGSSSAGSRRAGHVETAGRLKV